MKQWAWIAGAIVLALAGCGPKAYVKQGFLDHPPRRVAVLPFVITYAYDLPAGEPIPEPHAIGRDVLRKTFYHAITPYGYDDVKPADVDARLAAAFGPVEDGAWRAADPKRLGETVGADAVVFGEISRITHIASPLFTESSLTATLRMVDTATGEELWRTKVRQAERGGALMKKGQVVDFVKDQARSYKPEVKFLRISDAVVRAALREFPDPPMQANAATAAADVGTRAKLAILPFGVTNKKQRDPAERLRRSLAANLQDGPFEVIELQQVDNALADVGWREETQEDADGAVLQAAQQLGADLVLRGAITKWGRTYLVVESWVKAGLQVELLDAQTGQVIWARTKNNTRHAGVLKGPTGYKSAVTAPITGMKTSNLQRVGEHLARDLAEELKTTPAVLIFLSENASGPPAAAVSQQ